MSLKKIKTDFVLPVSFNCRFWVWVQWLSQGLTSLPNLPSRLYKQLNQQHADFLAFLLNPAIGVPLSSFGLYLCCCPRHLKEQVIKNICSTYDVLRQGEGNSEQPLYNGERIFVKLHSPLSPAKDGILSEEEIQNYHLK